MINQNHRGLGKTIEMISLVHTNRAPPNISVTESSTDTLSSGNHSATAKLCLRKNNPQSVTPINDNPPSPTSLVVAPMSLISQWRDEFTRCLPSDRILLYYGQERHSVSVNSLLQDDAPLVLITTYGVLSNDYDRYSRGFQSVFFDTHWWRIILDEAHIIKERSTRVAKAAYALHGDRRWCVTGTPIINRLEDLFSLIHFLKLQPWDNFSLYVVFYLSKTIRGEQTFFFFFCQNMRFPSSIFTV